MYQVIIRSKTSKSMGRGPTVEVPYEEGTSWRGAPMDATTLPMYLSEGVPGSNEWLLYW